jgi:hypothetical protein
VIPEQQKFRQVTVRESRQVGGGNVYRIDENRLPDCEKLFSAPFAQQERASHQQHDHQQ